MDTPPRSLPEILDRLPWFEDLSEEHQVELLNITADHISVGSPLSEFVNLLLEWSEVAHRDAKWARLQMLREAGLLTEDGSRRGPESFEADGPDPEGGW